MRKMKIGRNQPCPCGSGKKYKKCCLNKDAEKNEKIKMDSESNKDVTKTKAWEHAEFAYAEMTAHQMMPFGMFKMSPEEAIEQHKRIVEDCPKFYPSILGLGFKLLLKGKENGLKKIDEGFHLMLELAQPKQLDEELDTFISNLEKMWRFDLSKKYLEFINNHFPKNAKYYDYLAYAAVKIGDYTTALSNNLKAIELDPDNLDFKGNLGWMYLHAGNLKEASKVLDEVERLDPKNENVKYNLNVIKYLKKHGGKFIDYLLRPVDMKRLDKLMDEDKWEEAKEISDSVNAERSEAFALYLLQVKNKKGVKIHDLKENARIFFNFVRQVEGSSCDFIVDDNIDFPEVHFKKIMHKFIFKMGDIDKKIMDETYEALLLFYEMLSQSNLISSKCFKEFKHEILGMKRELMDKMDRYNEIRHDDSISDAQKEEIREELFDGDHAWPFL